MQSKRSRLDRYLSKQLSINRRTVHLLLAQKQVWLDQQLAVSVQQLVDEYTHVRVGDRVLQAKTPSYIMLNKPAGVVSATKDATHTTVIDLLGADQPKDLHIAGRLDFNSTGLLLLTNDGRWSRRLSDPELGVQKRYRVQLDKPVDDEVVEAFARGMHFPYEDVTTRPAKLCVIDEAVAEVTLTEGRYHQIKRMFGRFQIEVLALHRFAVGPLNLDKQLGSGQYRSINKQELQWLAKTTASRAC